MAGATLAFALETIKQEKVRSMLAPKISRALLVALGLAVTVVAPGCVVPVEAPVVAEGYEPAYYDGYVVYYDTAGVPYYYLDGEIRYVPRTYVQYDVLVHHYQVYRPHYQRWYVHHGYQYKRYHNPRHSPAPRPHQGPPHGPGHAPHHRR